MRDRAHQFLANYLAAGSKPAKEVIQAAQAEGIGLVTLNKISVGIVHKEQRQDGWYWCLPRTPSAHKAQGLWPYEGIMMSALTDNEFLALVQQVDDPFIREICTRFDRLSEDDESDDGGDCKSENDEIRRSGYVQALEDIASALMEIESQLENPVEETVKIFGTVQKELNRLARESDSTH